MTKTIFAVAGILLTADVCPAAQSPNFIIFYVDDLGWADTSVQMMDEEPFSVSDFYRTPHLERLAKRGMRFSNGYAPAPTCTPSRKSIQFGKTPARLKYTFVHDVLALKRGLKWKDEVSMADVIKGANKNYITAHFGKGMSGEQMKTIGYDVTDEFDGNAPNGNFHGEYMDLKSRKPVPDDDPKRIYSLTKRSVDFVTRHGGKRPFYMMVSHYAVHVPHAATSKLIEKYRKLPRGRDCQDGDYIDPVKMSKGKRTCAWRLQYAAMIEEVDFSLGAIVDAVRESGQLDNTYIIFTSDNGGGMKPNGPLNWGKAQLFEGGLRVPFIVAGPGVKAGAQCDVPVAQWDLLPTLHDLANSNGPLPKELDGGSLRDVLARGNDAQVIRPREGLVFHYPCYFAPPLSVIRLGDYKFLKHLNTGEVRLYDLKADYAEKTDLARSMPEKVAQLDAVLTRYLKSIDAEDVKDVYQARFEELDRFERMTLDLHKRDLARAMKAEEGAALAATKERLKKKRNEDLLRFDRNRKECAENMKATHWAGAAPKN